MRAMDVMLFVFALSIAINIVNDLDMIYYAENNRFLFNTRYEQWLDLEQYNDTSVNNTLIDYGITDIPAQSSDSFYLFQGAGILSNIRALFNIFIDTVTGFGFKLQRNFFNSMPYSVALGISVGVFIVFMRMMLTFLRGVYIE